MGDDVQPGDRRSDAGRWHGRGRGGRSEPEHRHEHDDDTRPQGGGERDDRREPPLHESLDETHGRPGGDYVYARDRLVIDAGDVDAVRAALAERFDSKVVETEPVDELGLVGLHLAPGGPDVPTLVDGVRGADGALRAFPDHVLARTSHPRFIPATTPRLAPARARPGGDGLPGQDDLPGDGLRIGVLDTGAWDHSWFDGRCDHRPGDDDDLADADGDGMLDHVAGHGTFIAGILLQHLPRATVVARRIAPSPQVPDQGYTTDTVLARTLLAHRELWKVHVLSLSVGGYTHDGLGLPATGRALRRCRDVNPDLVVVAGAGNDAVDTPFFPAAFKDVVAVGALDTSGDRACFSNFGWWVDACAAGVDVHSTFLEWDGRLAPVPGVAEDCAGRLPEPTRAEAFTGWAWWDGTSFAAPRVAAAIAARIGEGVSPVQAVADVVRAPGLRRAVDLGTVVDPREF